jgi:hypothetical protein
MQHRDLVRLFHNDRGSQKVIANILRTSGQPDDDGVTGCIQLDVGEVGKVGGELEADRDALGVPALNDAQRNEVRAYGAVRETDTAMSVVGALALAPQVEGPAQITGAQICYLGGPRRMISKSCRRAW